MRCILSLAGTDPTGGAGLQADLKTITSLDCYATSVVTAVVAQNSRMVRSLTPLPAELVKAQLACVMDEFRIEAIKIGMLGSTEIIVCVAEMLAEMRERHHSLPIVLDPVLRTSSGYSLLPEDALAVFCEMLLPHVTVLTPNIAEAAVLSGEGEAQTFETLYEQARALQKYVPWVLLKGGHLAGPESRDGLAGPGNRFWAFSQQRLETVHGRGTGCTLSTALACFLSIMTVPEAVECAQAYVYQALKYSEKLEVVFKHGPLNHFWKQEIS